MENDYINKIMNELKYIYKLHNQLMNRFCQQITPDQGKLLFYIKNQAMSQKELALKLHITEATLSVRIKRLMDAGFIERKNDNHDKRVYVIVLSKKGKQLTEAIDKGISLYQKKLSQGISDEEFETVLHVLNQIQRNIKEGMEC